jgi:hypothetical protein
MKPIRPHTRARSELYDAQRSASRTSNGNTDAEMNAILLTRATAAASHQAYFGTDKEAKCKATATA